MKTKTYYRVYANFGGVCYIYKDDYNDELTACAVAKMLKGLNKQHTNYVVIKCNCAKTTHLKSEIVKSKVIYEAK